VNLPEKAFFSSMIKAICSSLHCKIKLFCKSVREYCVAKTHWSLCSLSFYGRAGRRQKRKPDDGEEEKPPLGHIILMQKTSPSALGKPDATPGIQNTHMPRSSSTLCFFHFSFLLLPLHLAFKSRKAEMNASFAFWETLKASEIL